MPTEDRPKELRIRYDRSTTYPLPPPLACMYGKVKCDCPFCEAAIEGFYTGDFMVYRFGVQRWVDWLADRATLDVYELPCVGQSQHLARWLKAQRTVSS